MNEREVPVVKKVKKVLFIEDDLTLRNDTEAYFKKYNDIDEYDYMVSIVGCTNAGEASNKLEDESFNALIIDVMMPYGSADEVLGSEFDPDEVETGIRLLRKWREKEKQENREPIWVSVITARSGIQVRKDIEEVLGKGKAYYKPFDSLRFIDDLLKALDLPSNIPPELLNILEEGEGS